VERREEIAVNAKRALRLILSLGILAVVLSASSHPGFAAMNRADSLGAGTLTPPPKMHHPQHPDLDVTGIDVDMSFSPLADDFRCTQSGPIDQIAIWGSFFEDRLPPGGPESLTFEVAIYSDIPAGVEQRWSMPGRLLWSRVFEPGQYGVMLESDEAVQGWFDPMQQYWEPENHRIVFRYDFVCDRDPFIQEEGTIYWLVVRWLAPPRTTSSAGRPRRWICSGTMMLCTPPTRHCGWS
jgi:hypothetical protein